MHDLVSYTLILQQSPDGIGSVIHTMQYTQKHELSAINSHLYIIKYSVEASYERKLRILPDVLLLLATLLFYLKICTLHIL